MARRKKKRVIFWSLVVFGVVLLWSIGVAIAIARAGAANPDARGDVAIVLGAAVWGDVPSPVFKVRIDHAVSLYRHGQVKRILFTGGQAEGDSVSEAAAARVYAFGNGVPSDAIFVEPRSTSTKENLSNAKRVMREHGLNNAVIVSDPYHLLRAGMHADRLGMKYVLSPTPTSRYTGFSSQAGQLSRETFYVTRLMLTGI